MAHETPQGNRGAGGGPRGGEGGKEKCTLVNINLSLFSLSNKVLHLNKENFSLKMTERNVWQFFAWICALDHSSSFPPPAGHPVEGQSRRPCADGRLHPPAKGTARQAVPLASEVSNFSACRFAQEISLCCSYIYLAATSKYVFRFSITK